jgi:hypothetical protein
MSAETLSQCKLTRNHEHQMLWIPTKFATEGRNIGLREKTPQGGNYWDEGWTVEQVFTTMPQDYVLERSQDYKKTREASDI